MVSPGLLKLLPDHHCQAVCQDPGLGSSPPANQTSKAITVTVAVILKTKQCGERYSKTKTNVKNICRTSVPSLTGEPSAKQK